MRERETACVLIFQILKNWRKRSNSRRHVDLWDFLRRVSIGMHCKTIHDVDEGFEGSTVACREHTMPREDPRSEIIGHTKIGPVLHVKTTCCLDIFGIEIQIPSTSGDGSKSWVVMSRGSNRYVEELCYNDPDYSPGNHELANQPGVGKPHAIILSTEETRASQPKTQSNLMSDHIQIFCDWRKEVE